VFTKEVRDAGISTLKNICQSKPAAEIDQMPESVNWTSSYGTVGSLEENDKTSSDDLLSPPSNEY